MYDTFLLANNNYQVMIRLHLANRGVLLIFYDSM